MFSYGMFACLYAIASVSRLPKPPINGFVFGGYIDLIFFIIFALTLPAYLSNYFFIAWKNYSGYINNGPSTPT